MGVRLVSTSVLFNKWFNERKVVVMTRRRRRGPRVAETGHDDGGGKWSGRPSGCSRGHGDPHRQGRVMGSPGG